jgi:riboflavin synthase alpha subunit
VFTGIVTHRGTVRRRDGDGVVRPVSLWVAPEPPFDSPPRLGESVAIDGVCLTVAAVGDEGMRFDVVPETLRRTTLGAVAIGARVNLERALRVGDALGGHFVQGHVEGVGRVVSVDREGAEVRLVVRVGPPLAGAAVPKGSVTLDGVSLTVGAVAPDPGVPASDRLTVHLVPHTLAVTGLGSKRPGDPVNVEPDLLGRWVEHHLARLRDGERGTDPP